MSAGAVDADDVVHRAGRGAADGPTAPADASTSPSPAQRSRRASRPRYDARPGIATFYDNGTTAMRLPRGTVVIICGDGGCIERVVNDYGPIRSRAAIVDLYRPDFFDDLRLPVVVGHDHGDRLVY